MNRVKKISLITKTYEIDDIGQTIEKISKAERFAYVRDVSQSEFFNAGQNGFKPSKVFDVLVTEYNDEDEIECDDTFYQVYRTYTNYNTGRVELYTEKRVGEDDVEPGPFSA